MQRVSKANQRHTISIAVLEDELERDTLEMPIPTYIDPDDEPTGIWEITKDGRRAPYRPTYNPSPGWRSNDH